MAANLLATCPDSSLRNGEEAIKLASHAAQLTEERDPSVLDTLSAVYAENRNFAEAGRTGKRALSQAIEEGDAAMIAKVNAILRAMPRMSRSA